MRNSRSELLDVKAHCIQRLVRTRETGILYVGTEDRHTESTVA